MANDLVAIRIVTSTLSATMAYTESVPGRAIIVPSIHINFSYFKGGDGRSGKANRRRM